MEKFISLKDLLKLAKEEKLDLGKGDPYNRLRYYTKMGWLPHMVRKANDSGDIEGHYPIWSIDILRKIQLLKNEGLSNEQVDQKIKVQNNIQKTINILGDTNNRNLIGIYILTILVSIVLLTELNIINLGKAKTNTPIINTDITTSYIKEQGVGILLKETNEVFIKAPSVTETSGVNVTFKDNYFPATRYWIQDIRDKEGFSLVLDIPVKDSAIFYWFVSN
jgi:hypothetical protein